MLSSRVRAWSPVSVGRIHGDDLAGDEPVEQHADGGQMLLDGRLREVLAEAFDIGGDVERFDLVQAAELVAVAPVEEAQHGMVIRGPGVLVADGGGEEFQEAARGVRSGVGDDRRHGQRPLRLGNLDRTGRLNDCEFVHAD